MRAQGASAFAWVLLFVLRGLLLWIVIPLGILAWLVSVAWTRRSLGAFLGWLDFNLIALLGSTILRPIFPQPMRMVALREMDHLKHRVGTSDLF